MSRLRLEISDSALKDIANALDQSQSEFGADYADRYQAGISEALQRLVDPLTLPAGAARNDIREGLRAFDLRSCLPRARHTFFFRVTPAAVQVLRLLHHRQDMMGILWQATSDSTDHGSD